MDAAQQTGLNPQGAFRPNDEIVLKAGTVVKVGGFPFRLVRDTAVEGNNFNMAAAGGMLAGKIGQARGQNDPMRAAAVAENELRRQYGVY